MPFGSIGGGRVPAQQKRGTRAPSGVPRGYKTNPAAAGGKRFKTASGRMANVNPYQRKEGQYNPNFSPFGTSGGGPNPAAMGGFGFGGGAPAGQFSGGAGAGAGSWGGGAGAWGGGGWGGGPGGPARPIEEISLTAAPSPQMDEATRRWEEHSNWLRQQAEKTDANLQEQINLYRERMGEGPTTRAIERASSGIRDFAAGQAAEAQTAGAAMGRGAGFGATGIAESAQRAQAGAAADISLGREAQLDRLLATGTQIMGAPGQQRLAYGALGGQHFGASPYGEAAGLGLAEKELGLRAWQAPRELGIREMEAQSRAYGSPMDWYRMLFS